MSEPTNDPALPNFVWARDPFGPGGFVRLICHGTTLQKVAELGSRAKMGEYWGLVHGNPTRIPVIDIDRNVPVTSGIKHPVAVFRGLKRPMHVVYTGSDREILVYVTNPDHTYFFRYDRDGHGYLTLERPPYQSVFTTFVTLASEHIDAAVEKMRGEVPSDVRGVVLFWEWADSSPTEPRFPYESETRYGARLL